MTELSVCTKQKDRQWPFGGHLGLQSSDKTRFIKNIAHLKFERSQVTNDLECPQVQTDRRRPSWLAFIGKTHIRILMGD